MFRLGLALAICSLSAAKATAQDRKEVLGDPLPQGAIARLGTLRGKHVPATLAPINVLAFAPDGSKIASLNLNYGSVRLWDSVTRSEIPGPWATQRHRAPAFSTDGRFLAASGLVNQTLRNEVPRSTTVVFDIAAGKQIKALTGIEGIPQALVFAEGNKKLIGAGTAGVVSWWDVENEKQLDTWKPFADQIKVEGDLTVRRIFNSCAFSPDARSIVLDMLWYPRAIPGVPMQEPPRRIEQEAASYDLESRKVLWRTQASLNPQSPDGEPRPLAFSGDGSRVAVAMALDRIEVRNARTGKLIAPPFAAQLPNMSFLGGLALSSDGKLAAIAGGDSHILVWNPEQPTPPRKFTARIGQYWNRSTHALRFSPDDKMLLVGVDSDLQLYDVETLQEIRPAEGHRGWIDSVAFSADGNGCSPRAPR